MPDPTRSADPARASILRARGVTKVYRLGEVEVHALRGVDLDLFEGEFVVLLGASGSGKSTLLNILGGLDLPTAGMVGFRDQDLTRADEGARTRYRRENVGFVFQFYNLIPSLTARENVALVTDIVRAPMKPEDALGLVGLAHRLDLREADHAGRARLPRDHAPPPLRSLEAREDRGASRGRSKEPCVLLISRRADRARGSAP